MKYITKKIKELTKAFLLDKTNRTSNGKKCIVCKQELTGKRRKYCTDKCARNKTTQNK